MSIASVALVDPKSRKQQSHSVSTSSVRSCIICQRSYSPSELLHIVFWENAFIAVEHPKKVPGRCAHICLNRVCLAKMSKRICHALDVSPAVSLDTDVWLGELHHRARLRVLEIIGLARRAGLIAWGVERVIQEEKTVRMLGSVSHWEIVLCASDLSERSLRRLDNAVAFETSDVLGQATGLGNVGVIAIAPSALAVQLHYWVRIWQCTKPAGAEPNGNQLQYTPEVNDGKKTST